jgi:HEAT repeat protein
MKALIGVALALALVGVAWTIVFVATRVAIARRRRTADEALERMRPLALQIAYEDEPPDLTGLGERDLEALATLVARYGRQLRGESRERLESFFADSGATGRQRELLQRGGAWRRATAAFSLGDMGATAAVPDLIGALDDRDRAVRIAAARSLGVIGAPEAAPALVESLTSGSLPWLVGGQALIDLGSHAAPSLRALAAEPGAPARGRAIELLGFVGEAGDAAVVFDALVSESPDLRERAARALGRLGARDAVEALRRALADPEPAVAAAAATSIGAIGDRGAVEDLLQLARTGPFRAARAAARAAASLDPRAVERAADAPGAGQHLGEAADLAAL